MVYIFIFLSKLIIDSLTTYRVIILSKGYKFLSAILEFIISIIWVFMARKIVLDNDLFKIFIFASSSFFGSLSGSFLGKKKGE